jgi:hypothetical protein
MAIPQLGLPLATFKFSYNTAAGDEVSIAFKGETIQLVRQDVAAKPELAHSWEFDAEEATFVSNALLQMALLVPEWIKKRDKLA